MPLHSLILAEGPIREYSSDFPRELITGTGADPRPRMRVDVGQTGFWEGRMFRTFYEFSIGVGATAVVRFVAVEDFIIHKQHLTVDDGFLRFSAALGGTAGGTFVAAPTIGMNRMANRPVPNHEPLSGFSTGGTHTGGTEVEVVRLKASGATAQAASVGETADSARGLPAGTYHLRFQNLGNGTLTGVYTLEWEEWKPRSPIIY